MPTIARPLRYRRFVVGSDVIVLLLAGLLYAWSIFVIPLESEFGWQRAQTSMTYTISIAANTIMAWMAARIAKKIKPQWVVRIAALAVLLGFIGASQVQALWQLYLCYGVLCAGGLGMVYNLTLSTIVGWYPEKPGVMSGAMLMCYGLGTMVFGSLVEHIIAVLGWRSAFLIIGVVCFGILLLGAQFVRRPSQQEQEDLPPPAPKAEAKFEKELVPKTMVREKSFWLYFFWTIALATVGLVLNSHASSMAQTLGISSSVAALYVSAVSMCNGGGRLLFGAVFDRLGRRRTMLMVNLLSVLGAVLLWGAYHFSWRGVMLAAFMLLGLSFGGSPICSANYVKSMYGEKNYGENLGFGNLSVLFAAYIGPYFAGVVYELAGYQLVAAAMIGLSLVGTLLGVALYRLKAQKSQVEN